MLIIGVVRPGRTIYGAQTACPHEEGDVHLCRPRGKLHSERFVFALQVAGTLRNATVLELAA